MLGQKELEDLGYRIKRQEKEAFHLLYTEYFAELRTYAQRFVYDYDEAEDIVQDAFFSLWQHVHHYRPEQNVISYLLAIIKNQCYNYLRKLRIQDEHQDKLIEAMVFSGIEDPEIDEDLRRRLYEVLGKMSDKERSILLEHIIEQKKVKEIAARMGIAESTVKTYLKRAMRLLRQNLCYIIIGF